MKLLVIACVALVCRAAPVAKPDSDNDHLHTFGTNVFATNVHHPVAFTGGIGAVPVSYSAGGSQVVHHTSSAAVPQFAVGHGVSFVPTGAVQFQGVPTFHHQHGSQFQAHQFQTAPVATYSAGAAAPALTTYNVAAAPAVNFAAVAPVATTYNAFVAPAVATFNTVAVAPAAVAAVRTAITYQSEQRVQLADKEIDVTVQHNTVHIPVEKRVHVGVHNFVTGSQITIHKPKLSAPAIAAPQVFVEKKIHAAPEVTLTHSEVTVEKSSPNYIAAPYDAGVVVEHAAPEYKQVDVPTPVDVPHPVPVAQPYAVPVAHPVKVKSSVTPYVNVDVHSVQTQNVVTPVEYQAHHHVVAAPVVAHAAVAPVSYSAGAVPVFSQAAAAGQVVTYGAVAHGAAVTFNEIKDDSVFRGQNIHFQGVNQVQQAQFSVVNAAPQQVQYSGINSFPVQYVSGSQSQFQVPHHQFGGQFVTTGQQSAAVGAGQVQFQIPAGQQQFLSSQGTQFTAAGAVPATINYSANHQNHQVVAPTATINSY